jgi:hypothetical protein
MEPLPTTMERGWKAEGVQEEEILPGYGVVWLEAPKSATPSMIGVGAVSSKVLKEPARNCGSHSLDHGV